jgi:hypothetical protein
MTWRTMNRRCHSPTDPSYHRYGGRGIVVAPEWRWIKGSKTHNNKAFLAFVTYVGERPDRMTLDRIDNALGYEPGNVRWATARQQSNNKGVHVDRMPVTSKLSDKNMKRWNLFLSKKLIEAYREMGKKHGVSAAEMVRIALEKYLQAHEKAKKQALEAANAAG